MHYRHFLALNILEYSGIRLLLIHSLLLSTNSLQHFILRVVVHHAQMVLLGRLYKRQVYLLGLLRLLVVLSQTDSLLRGQTALIRRKALVLVAYSEG